MKLIITDIDNFNIPVEGEYRMGAQIGWRQMIKANGGKTKDLGKIPE